MELPSLAGPLLDQIPQYARAVWQEYLDSRDRAWLAHWYEPLQRYARVMDRRDAECRTLGLWPQRHFYEGLDMFPPADRLNRVLTLDV